MSIIICVVINGDTMQNITFIDSFISYWQHGFNWSGRITRSEFWFAQIGMLLLFFVLKAFSVSPIFSNLLFIINFLPFTSATVRRLHDIGKSAHTLWIVPLCWFLFLVLCSLFFACLNYLGITIPILQKIHPVIFVLGGYVLVFIVPIIGFIAGFIPSQNKENKYGMPQ